MVDVGVLVAEDVIVVCVVIVEQVEVRVLVGEEDVVVIVEVKVRVLVRDVDVVVRVMVVEVIVYFLELATEANQSNIALCRYKYWFAAVKFLK